MELAVACNKGPGFKGTKLLEKSDIHNFFMED